MLLHGSSLMLKRVHSDTECPEGWARRFSTYCLLLESTSHCLFCGHACSYTHKHFSRAVGTMFSLASTECWRVTGPEPSFRSSTHSAPPPSSACRAVSLLGCKADAFFIPASWTFTLQNPAENCPVVLGKGALGGTVCYQAVRAGGGEAAGSGS